MVMREEARSEKIRQIEYRRNKTDLLDAAGIIHNEMMMN